MMDTIPNWLDWYNVRHQKSCQASGEQFEDYVNNILGYFHDDFINPVPIGRYGDGGCDGLADSGEILYACYGRRPSTPKESVEKTLAKKIRNDFVRGKQYWPNFLKWRFITNAPVGPIATSTLLELQQEHKEGTERPLEIRVWDTENLWKNIISNFDKNILNEIYPGVPGVENLELSDLIPLLEELGKPNKSNDFNQHINPVSKNKMDFNKLPAARRFEFNEGRLMAQRINRWYEGQSDPNLYDLHGERFKEIYQKERSITEDPSEILERIYVAIAGANFRMDAKRANAAYAIVSYFFDSCHIFEAPS